MIVVNNRLKKVKKKYDDDGKNEYLEAIKFSHVKNKHRDINIRVSDKQTKKRFSRGIKQDRLKEW